jgi:hypothetical protein
MKKFIPALGILAVYLIVLVFFGFFVHAVVIFRDYLFGPYRDGGYTIFYSFTVLLPIVAVLIFRNLKGLLWANLIALMYTVIDYFVIKPATPGCEGPCGLENIFFGVVLAVFLLITIAIHLVIKSKTIADSQIPS